MTSTVIFMALALILSFVPEAQAKCGKKHSQCKVLIKASPKVVYSSILNLRQIQPKHVKELSKSKTQTLIEEEFHVLPIIGKAKCIYKETYVPGKQVSYKLVRSDRFKAFEGQWSLTPKNNGRYTSLALSSYVDPGLSHIPFAKQITNMETKKGIKKRLHAVKRISEKRQLAMSKSQAKIQ